MSLIIISGLSGSGKTIALKTLEDNGFYCVDNLPFQLLPELLQWHQKEHHTQHMAISMDARTMTSPVNQEWFSKLPTNTRILFLESRDDVLLQRFAQTHRIHPLSWKTKGTLPENLHQERSLLAPLRDVAFVMDTSDMGIAQLRHAIQNWLQLPERKRIMIFSSFGFKYGIPADANNIFDVRILPNPYWHQHLQTLTGQDQPVKDFFQAEPDVQRMIDDIEQFIRSWLFSLPMVHIAVGCTGGQHRSVYVAESLAEQFKNDAHIEIRHRDLS